MSRCIGVLVGSVVMLVFYAPVAARSASSASSLGDPSKLPQNPETQDTLSRPAWVPAISWFVPIASVVILIVFGIPRFAENFKPVQLRDSWSMSAMGEMNQRLTMGDEGTQSVVIAADDVADLPGRMKLARKRLGDAVESDALTSFILPEALVPDLENQKANREILAFIVADKKRLVTAVEKAGFNQEALVLTRQVFSYWDSWLSQEDGESVSPSHSGSRWIMDRLFSIDDQGRCAVLGRVTLKSDLKSISATTTDLAGEGIHITGWDTLDPTVNRLIHRDSVRVFIPVGLVLIAMLSFIFRDWRDIFLSLAVLIFSVGALMAITSLFKIEWNAFSISSIPILFGVGLDYSIHMIFALRRNDGNLLAIRQGISRAILFCGLSTAVGFGSLSMASNLGLASIGRICGLGVLIIMVTTLGLLPHWWRRLRGEDQRSEVRSQNEQ